jgi:hypothetical protein
LLSSSSSWSCGVEDVCLSRERSVAKTLTGEMTGLVAEIAATLLDLDDDLAKDEEIDLMRDKTKHDEIGIGTENAMSEIGIVASLLTLSADILHDLVLSLTRDRGIGNNDTETENTPKRIMSHAIRHIPMKKRSDASEEMSTRSDDIGIPNRTRFRSRTTGLEEFIANTEFLPLLIHGLLSSTITTRTLLIHLSTRSNTIHGKIKKLARTNNAN